MIVENDIRLLRRWLVANQLQDQASADRLETYLRARPFKFLLPGEQTEKGQRAALARLRPNERELAVQYGMIILPQYYDAVFLNSMWRNPKTLYVHLVEPVPELGDLGEIYWITDK